MKHNEDNIQWVRVMEFNASGFAEMAAQILEDHQIPWLLQKDPVSTIYSFGGSGVGNSFVLLVPEEFLEEAQQLLENMANS